LVIIEIAKRAKPANITLKAVVCKVPFMTYEVEDHIFNRKVQG